jgi:hypothetical protein
VWESRERKGAASKDRDFNASEKPEDREGMKEGEERIEEISERCE